MTSLKLDDEINPIVKKHKAIINCENSLPLASRKIFNILLFLVKDRFGKDIEHQVSENDVIALLNKTDKDITNARLNYKKLASTVIEYNILNSDKDHLNGIGTMLAPAEVNTTRKLWNFSFPPNIVKWVQDPKSFVFLDITTQERFCSKYSQALWEICIGSLGDQEESYFSVSLDECRLLMCGKDNHQTYKDFKRRVIAVALTEINDKSILNVELYKEVKEGRKVSELVFFVTKQDYVDSDLLVEDDDDDLYIKMVDVFGITSNVASLMMDKYDSERILRNLEYTEQQYRKAVTKNRESQFNLGAYATSAITKDFAPKQPQLLIQIHDEKIKKKLKEENAITIEQNNFENSKRKVITIFEGIEESVKKSLKNDFEKNGLRGPVKKLFEKEGWGDQIMNQFYIFLTSQIEQGRKGQGYDEIFKQYNMTSVR